jgi:sporulation integral membrane protein YtvI
MITIYGTNGGARMLKKAVLRYRSTAIFFVIYTCIFLLVSSALKYLFPFLFGFLLALALQPLVTLLYRLFHCKKGPAALVTTLVSFLILFGLLFLLSFKLVSELIALVAWLSQTDYSQLMEPVLHFINRIGEGMSRIDADFIAKNREQLFTIAQNGVQLITVLLKGLLGFLSSIPAVFTMVLVAVFSTYFFTKDMDTIKCMVTAQLNEETIRQLSTVTRHGFAMMGRYLLSYLILYLITFLESLVIFHLLGVSYPLVFSLVAGVADIIPIIGPGAVYFPLAVSAIWGGNTFQCIALLLAWLAITLVRQIIEPKLVSSSIDVHPLAMLAALYCSLVSGSLWVFVYLVLLFVLYQILKKVGMLPPLFPVGTRAERVFPPEGRKRRRKR